MTAPPCPRNLTRTCVRGIALIVFVCARTTPVLALDPDRSLAQIHHTAWTAEDGAPSQISAITQTGDGYLWIGSARGLFRFDGVTFEHYMPPDSVQLPSHNIYALATTPDGDLWISFRPFGIGCVHNGRLETFIKPGEIPSTEVFDLACCRDGRVFAAARDGLYIRTSGRWAALGSDWNLPPGRVQSLFVDHDGTLWAASEGQINTLEPGSTEFRHVGDAEWVANMSQGADGAIWSSQLDHVTTLPNSQWAHEAGCVIHQSSGEILVDRDGCLWMATSGEGLQRVRKPNELKGDIRPGDPRIESIRAPQGLSGDAAHVLFEDREGNIWVGTAKGIDQFRHNHMVPVTLPHGYEGFTLIPDKDGGLWVGSAKGKELLHVSAEKVEVLNFKMAAASACRDADGVIWWGAPDRVVRQDGRNIRWYPLFDTPNQEWLWEVFRGDVKDAFWVSVGDMGLYYFHNGVWEKHPRPSGLPDEGPSASFLAADGRTWLGYNDFVCVLDGTKAKTYARADGIETGRVRVIRGRGQRIWVGGELGLAFFDGGRFHMVACAGPAPFGTVGGIIATADGSLWLNELRGIVHIVPEEIERLDQDPGHAVNFRRYDVNEGLPGAGQMNWNCSTATEATDGKLWFATDGGLAWIDPARMSINALPPPVVVRSITTENGTFNPGDPIRLANRTATLRIDYTALSLCIPERVHFRYRLDGYDTKWVDAGSRRTAFYTRLRPGSYKFHVEASNNDDVWNDTVEAAAFSIAPAFYQTGWFAAICLFGVLCGLWLAYRVRVRQMAIRLQRMHDERMDERMRIAHELHDTLLQGFLSASMQLHVAREAIPAELSARQQVSRVLKLMDGVIGDARLAVRGLRSQESTDLEHALAHIAHEAGAQSKADLRVVTNGRALSLRPTARDEVYRIGREGIMNALRHAGARTIEAEITYLPRELRLVVRDDGRGIDTDVVHSGRDGHFGLSGMRERAHLVSGKLTVRSGAGLGTEIELIVPGRVAFVGAPHANALTRAVRSFRNGVSGRREET